MNTHMDITSDSEDEPMHDAVPSGFDDVQLLFAPASAVVDKYPDDGTDDTDMHKHLVTVVPMGAQVRITTVDAPVTDAGDGSHWADYDLRRGEV